MTVPGKISLISILILLIGSGLTAQMISHSHHDFGKKQWNVFANCSPCHTSLEKSQKPVVMAWSSHELETYNIYAESIISGEPGSTSKLCLTCHDGTIGMESHSGLTYSQHLTSEGLVEKNLIKDHPVSVPYEYGEKSAMEEKLKNPNSLNSALGGTVAETLLENGKVECISCHDIHLTQNTMGCKGCHTLGTDNPVTIRLSLWLPQNVSALCQACHLK